MKTIPHLWKKLLQNESGLILPTALILMLLGAFIVPPLLDLAVDSMENNDLHLRKANRIHTSDAGVQHGIWTTLYSPRLATALNKLNPANPAYDQYDFSTQWEYVLTGTNQMNRRDQQVVLSNVWIPEANWELIASVPSPDDPGGKTPKDIIRDMKLIVEGSVIDPGNPYNDPPIPGLYNIRIVFRGIDADYHYFPMSWMYPPLRESLPIEQIGIWVPEGYNVATKTCSLLRDATWDPDPFGQGWPYYVREVNTNEAGGGSKKYTYDLQKGWGVPNFADFSHIDLYDPGTINNILTQEVNVTFRFDRLASTGTTTYVDFVPWITTRYDPVIDPLIPAGLTPTPYSWDPRARIYNISGTSLNQGNPEGKVETVATIMREVSYAHLFDNAITTSGSTTLYNESCVSGTVVYGSILDLSGDGSIRPEGCGCSDPIPATCTDGGSEPWDPHNMDMPQDWELEAYYWSTTPKPGFHPITGGFTVAKDEIKIENARTVNGPVDFKPGGISLEFTNDVFINGGLDHGAHPVKFRGASTVMGENLVLGGGSLDIGGNMFIDGDLDWRNPAVVHLNGHTIYSTGSVLAGNGVFLYGPGCIVAAGDVQINNSAANGPGDFIFLMSLNGKVDFKNSGTWYGSIACDGDWVRINTGADIIHTDWEHLGLDFPALDVPDDALRRLNVHTWDIEG